MSSPTDYSTTFGHGQELRARVRGQLEAEYARLHTVDRPALLQLLADKGQVEGGTDASSETVDVLAAELAVLEERIAAVHDYLNDLHEPATGGQPSLGSAVEVDLDDGPRWMLLASLPVADDDVIAVDSPLGRAVLAAHPGEEFAFAAPDGPRTGRLLAIEGVGALSPGAGALSRLERAEALRLLGEAQTGALAFSMLGTPHVEVVNFILDGEEPVFRIGSSAKLAAVGRGAPFALHVNRVDEQARAGWSVTVTGQVKLVRGDEAERLTALVVPWAGGRRPYVVKMTIHQVEGRRLDPA
jgi:uncharacterized protein